PRLRAAWRTCGRAATRGVHIVSSVLHRSTRKELNRQDAKTANKTGGRRRRRSSLSPHSSSHHPLHPLTLSPCHLVTSPSPAPNPFYFFPPPSYVVRHGGEDHRRGGAGGNP